MVQVETSQFEEGEILSSMRWVEFVSCNCNVRHPLRNGVEDSKYVFKPHRSGLIGPWSHLYVPGKLQKHESVVHPGLHLSGILIRQKMKHTILPLCRRAFAACDHSLSNVDLLSCLFVRWWFMKSFRKTTTLASGLSGIWDFNKYLIAGPIMNHFYLNLCGVLQSVMKPFNKLSSLKRIK